MNRWLEWLLGMAAFRRHVHPVQNRSPEANFYETAERVWTLDSTVDGELPSLDSEQGLMVVANHPRGLLDLFLIGGWIEKNSGRPVRFLVNRMIGETLPTVNEHIIGVDNMSRHGPKRSAFNRDALNKAVAFLKSGGVLYVCPAGQVSSWRLHSPEGWCRRTDHPWHLTFVAMAREAEVAIQPLHLSGHNRFRYRAARLFGRVFGRLMNFREFAAGTGSSTHATVGQLLEWEELNKKDDAQISRLCRARVFACAAHTESL